MAADKTAAERQQRRRQRVAYAMRRMSLAVDRIIRKEGDPVRNALWVKAWARKAGVK